MFSNMYFYLMVVVLVFAVGDMIGHFTKGKLSGMMMVMLLFRRHHQPGRPDPAGPGRNRYGSVQYGYHHQHQADGP